jgi:transposase InsO family protein
MADRSCVADSGCRYGNGDRHAAATAQLASNALLMAVWRRGRPDALLHHSGKGSQYTSEQFLRLIADHCIIRSLAMRLNWRLLHDPQIWHLRYLVFRLCVDAGGTC